MDAAEAMNHIARAVEEALGEPTNSQDGAPPRGNWLPLSVRYAAAEAAARVVTDWKAAAETASETDQLDAADLLSLMGSAVSILRSLGGMMPGTREVVDAVVEMLDVDRAQVTAGGA